MKLQLKADNYALGSTVIPTPIYAKLTCTQPQPFWARCLIKFIVNVVKKRIVLKKSCLLRQADAQFSF